MSISALASMLRREILLLPPVLALLGLASYVVRHAWLMGTWAMPPQHASSATALGGHAGLVLAAMACCMAAAPLWLGQQGYRLASSRWRRRPFWIGLLLYLAVGYAIIGVEEGVLPPD